MTRLRASSRVRAAFLVVGVAMVLAAVALAVVVYLWPHFPPLDLERTAPVWIAAFGGLGVALLIVLAFAYRGADTAAGLSPFPLNNDG
jgi:hypothetical protein